MYSVITSNSKLASKLNTDLYKAGAAVVYISPTADGRYKLTAQFPQTSNKDN